MVMGGGLGGWPTLSAMDWGGVVAALGAHLNLKIRPGLR